MSFDEACKTAYELLGNGFTEIKDLGDCWYFWGCDPEIKPLGPQPIIIFKESGEVTDWMELVFGMHHSDEGESLPIPPEYAYKK